MVGHGISEEVRSQLKQKDTKARDSVPVGENSKCKGPAVGKKLVHMRARKKAALAEAHRGRGRV